MTVLAPCPLCQSTYTYALDDLLVCPECGHEWNPNDEPTAGDSLIVKDTNGNILQNGDTVVTIKTCP